MKYCFRQWSNEIHQWNNFCQLVVNVVEQDYVKGGEKDAAVIKIWRVRAKKIILTQVRRATNKNILIHKEPERFRFATKISKYIR